MNSQDTIEQSVRLVIGDLHLQLIMARARIAELEQQLQAPQEPEPAGKANGRDEQGVPAGGA
jgi:hypothetical protein